MKKLFTLLAIFMAAMSASAETVEQDLELVGSQITLPPTYFTGKADFQNFKKYGEVTLYDRDQTEDGKGANEFSTDDWQTLHLEFESLPEDVQIKFNTSDDNATAKYRALDNTQSPLTYDIALNELGYDEGSVLTHIGIMSTAVQSDPVVITKACLVNADGDELPLYYVNLGNGGWGVKIVGSSKLLSGTVEFLKRYAQLGGDAWCPKDLLANATNASWTITLNEGLPSEYYQLIVTDKGGKDYYYDELSPKGATVITYDVNAQLQARPTYAPATPSDVSKVRLQMKAIDGDVNKDPGAYTETIDVNSVKLKVDGVSTGINSTKINTASRNDAPIYNLSGQRVAKPAKGIYIQNGHKFIVK